MVKRKKAKLSRTSVKKKTTRCPCNEKPLIGMGIVLLVISIVLYLGYGLTEILGALGILMILKGFWLYKKR